LGVQRISDETIANSHWDIMVNWVPRDVVFATSNATKRRLFLALQPPPGCRYFPYQVRHEGFDVDPEIQGAPRLITKHKVDQVRQRLGYDERKDIVMEDSQIEIEDLGGMPGPMTKQFVPALPETLQKCGGGLRCVHRSTLYWNHFCGHQDRSTVYSVEIPGRLELPPDGYTPGPRGGFDSWFRPDGWNRAYRTVMRGSGSGAAGLEPMERMVEVRLNLGCGLTRVFLRFFLGVVARRAVEERLLEEGQFGTVRELRRFVLRRTQAEVTAWFAVTGLHQGYKIGGALKACVDDMLKCGVGVGESGVRICPVTLDGLRSAGYLPKKS